ncbi:Crp/Fnr family transcriptional regulator [Propionivibrio sp.]|uniref:Crp/Fnr family transcriptional regulator n=1 Tax=Propionivibrio sp. TaxID=2212460 RepID=UPI003BF18ECF
MMELLPGSSDLNPSELATLLASAVIRSYPKNAVILNEGDEGDSVYFVLAGKVKIFLSNDQGREVVIGQFGPGDYFGEMLLEPGSRSASVMTLDASRFAVVRLEEFREFLKTHPDFMLALVGKLIRRSRTLARNVKSLALLDVYGRLAQLLHEMARPHGNTWFIDEPLTQQEIANRIGSSREMISRIFKDLVAGGYLIVSRQRIEIKRHLPTAW